MLELEDIYTPAIDFESWYINYWCDFEPEQVEEQRLQREEWSESDVPF